MVTDKTKPSGQSVADKTKTSHPVTDMELTRKFNILRKYIQNCNNRIHHVKRRLYLVTKEVKALKKGRESDRKTVKKAERIERKLDAEKTKLKRKVLKAGEAGGTKQKPQKEPRKENVSTESG